MCGGRGMGVWWEGWRGGQERVPGEWVCIGLFVFAVWGDVCGMHVMCMCGCSGRRRV